MLDELIIVDYRSWIYNAHEKSKNFNCGKKDLDEYLQRNTDLSTNKNKFNILLATFEDEIVGFVAYSIDNLFPGSVTMISKDETYPYMVIDALAVHKDFKGNKIGMILLSKVIEITCEINLSLTLHGIYLCAYRDAVEFYINKFSFVVVNQFLYDNPNYTDSIPMRLGIEAVVKLYFAIKHEEYNEKHVID